MWGREEGGNSFADDPPNADFTCSVDGEVVNYIVELTSPSMAGDDLSYSVAAVGDTVLPETQISCERGERDWGGVVVGGVGLVIGADECGLWCTRPYCVIGCIGKHTQAVRWDLCLNVWPDCSWFW